ncbi:MAG: hypothetical protein R2729_10045 [Bryobacteraceae bacterium]
MKRLAQIALLCLAPAGIAAAGLLGDLVAMESRYPDLGATTSTVLFTVVDPAIEVNCTSAPCISQSMIPGQSFDLDDDSIHFEQHLTSGLGFSYSGATFNGWVFSSLDLGSPITGVAFSQTGFTNLDASDVSFTADTVFVNLENASSGIDASWTVQLLTGVAGPGRTAPTPEPATAAMVSAALAALAALRKRT